MNYDELLATGLDRIPVVREFCGLYPDAEHIVGKALRDIDGWQIVYEWISRSPMYERYVVWLVVAISIDPDGSLSELTKPEVYVVEISEIIRSRNEYRGPSWKFGWAELEDGEWEQLVESGGDYSAIGLELITDAPVERFTEFYVDTRPPPMAEPPDGIPLKAPLRYMMRIDH